MKLLSPLRPGAVALLLSRVLHRVLVWMTVCTTALVLVYLAADSFSPLPELPTQDYARHLLASDGSVLTAWPATDGRWRNHTDIDAVSPRYLQALLGYEDRWFYRHPGINPFAFMRAIVQALLAGRIVSGGSTLTMQTARVLYPIERNLPGKAIQCLRALQLERRYSKRQILNLYLNNAPFGGTLHGVEAASRAYFGKSSATLSPAEAALLSVLPQAPSRLRPDRHPDRARAARDKVIRRMKSFAYWDAALADRALMEPVRPRYRQQRLQAPLLAERLLKPESSALRTYIDPDLQRRLETHLRQSQNNLPPGVSVAALVLNNKSAQVRAYVGSGDYLDPSRYGAIDMIRAIRSPGSTLKPFIYGLAIDEGLIHSQSLLADVHDPRAAYQPKNFDGNERGPVSVSEALQSSLNIPAVNVLKHLGPAHWLSTLRTTPVKLRLPAGDYASLAIALGGIGTNLESLVSLYRALDSEGKGATLRFTADDAMNETRLLSPGASWIIKDILRGTPRPASRTLGESAAIPFKTGTSYGHRDAWAIGITQGHTVGVWIGRPDGTPIAGQYGAASAAPVLFELADMLKSHSDAIRSRRPDSVTSRSICWPEGRLEANTAPNHCAIALDAWVLNAVVPLTLVEDEGEPLGRNTLIDAKTGLRVSARCAPGKTKSIRFVRWPDRLSGWEKRYARLPQMPAWHEHCKNRLLPEGQLLLGGINQHAVLRPRPGRNSAELRLTVSNAYGTVRWLHNGVPIPANGSAANGRYLSVSLARPGKHSISAIDEQGAHDTVEFQLHIPDES